jgi:F-type H+-transporting ATPase subunit a
LQASVEMVFSFVEDTVLRFGGPHARQAVPFFVTVFVFIFFGSLFGLLPFKYTFTSQLIVTVGLALTVFAYVNVLALRTHGFGFFRIFVPTGTPVYLTPLMIVIELMSYLFRPITLGLRLFANILAGHIMLKLFGDFCVMLTEAYGAAGIAASILPFVAMIAMYGVEICVFLIQSYIFIVLSSLYVKDAVGQH